MRPPDYTGGGLVNLVAELERRLTGKAPVPGLRPDLGTALPDAATYLLVLLDGLGDAQLAHPAAAPLAAARRGALDAPFPTTTTVSLATIATGLPPARHGLIAYQLWLPDREQVANTIKWTTLWGDPMGLDFDGFLPRPNLWERAAAAGVEPIVIQPLNFGGTPLSRVLYRGCRVEPYHDPGRGGGRRPAAVPAPPAPGAALPAPSRLRRPRLGPAIRGVRGGVAPHRRHLAGPGRGAAAGGSHGGHRRPRPRGHPQGPPGAHRQGGPRGPHLLRRPAGDLRQGRGRLAGRRPARHLGAVGGDGGLVGAGQAAPRPSPDGPRTGRSSPTPAMPCSTASATTASSASTAASPKKSCASPCWWPAGEGYCAHRRIRS